MADLTAVFFFVHPYWFGI